METNDYPTNPSRKPLFIGLGIGAGLIVLTAVAGFVLWTRSQPAEEGQPFASTNGKGTPSGQESVNSGTGQGGQQVNLPAAVMPPSPPERQPLPTKVESGIDRYLTSEEKALYGFDPSAQIRMKSVSSASGPRLVFVDETPREPDKDGDGLTDKQEAALGTNPENSDTDGDGLLDYYEVNVSKTDPKKADTDGDGRDDATEVKAGTNPLKAD